MRYSQGLFFLSRGDFKIFYEVEAFSQEKGLKMELRLMDYAGRSKTFEIGDIEEIARITITVISGDEIATVIYKGYSSKEFDSSNSRMADFYDDEYDIYDVTSGLNLLDDPEFKNRKTSYWREW